MAIKSNGKKKKKGQGTTGTTGEPRQVKARVTTLGQLTGSDGPEWQPEGPPGDAVEAMVNTLITVKGDAYHLREDISAEQAQTDGAAWFGTAGEYVERTAQVMIASPQYFPGFRYTGAHLLARLSRVKVLQRAGDLLEVILGALRRTQYMEAADLLKLADTAIGQVQGTLSLPSTPEADKTLMQRNAGLALRVWQARQAGIQQNKAQNARQEEAHQAELDAANQRADAAQAAADIRAGKAVTAEAALLANGPGNGTPATPAPATSRRARPRG